MALASTMPLILFEFTGKDFQGFGACFNVEQLEERVYGIYGLYIMITVVDSLMKPVPVQQVQNTQAYVSRLRAEKVVKLRSLATEELPTHECSLRREILAARAELERMGETWQTAPAA